MIRQIGRYYIFEPTNPLQLLLFLEREIIKITNIYASTEAHYEMYEYIRLDKRVKGDIPNTFGSKSAFNRGLKPCTHLMLVLYGVEI